MPRITSFKLRIMKAASTHQKIGGEAYNLRPTRCGQSLREGHFD